MERVKRDDVTMKHITNETTTVIGDPGGDRTTRLGRGDRSNTIYVLVPACHGNRWDERAKADN